MPAPSTVPDEFALLHERFAGLTDPRFARGKVHPRPGVLALVVLGLLAGCRSLSAVSRYGAIHPEVLGPLGPRRGPSVATLHRLLGAVRVAEVRPLVRAFAGDLVARRGAVDAVREVALDGKPLRGTHEDGDGAPLHVLRVSAQHAALALDRPGARRAPPGRGDRRDGVGAGPRRGVPGAGDPDRRCAGCRANAARGGGCRAARLRAAAQTNQPALFADAAFLFADAGPADRVTVEKGHGRLERRELRVRADLAGTRRSRVWPRWPNSRRRSSTWRPARSRAPPGTR
jgi:DDE_Tnp_1-associated